MWDAVNTGLASFLCFGALMSYFDVMLKLKRVKPFGGADRATAIRLPAFYRLDLICLAVFTLASGTDLLWSDRTWMDWLQTGLSGIGLALIFSVWVLSHDASRATKFEIRGRAAQHVKKGRKPEWLPMK